MPETQTFRSGLLTTEGTPIPVMDVVVEARVRVRAARIVILRRYRNDEAPSDPGFWIGVAERPLAEPHARHERHP